MAPSNGSSESKKKFNSKKRDAHDDRNVIAKRKTIGTPGADVVDTMKKRRVLVRGDRSINYPVVKNSSTGEEETILLLDSDDDVDDMPQ